METGRFEFNCKVAVNDKSVVFVVSRELPNGYGTADKRHHVETFDDTLTAYGPYEFTGIPAGYYNCKVDLVYTMEGYLEPEADSDLEFRDFELIAEA